MIRFPFAKINLGLNVVERRPDGYHEIQSILVPIPLHDVLEAVVETSSVAPPITFTRSGVRIDGPIETDLCFRAIESLRRHHELPNLRIHLHKVVPMGAGLGGGSSDGAHTLLLVNELCDLNLSYAELYDLASQLGSDCPFFLAPGPKLVQGRGEQLSSMELNMNGLWLVLIYPGVHISTAEAYRNTEPTGRPWGDLRSETPESWSSTFVNTMEPYAFNTYPEIGSLKERLANAGALYASMSGSGSSVFGLFSSQPEPINLPAHYRHWTLRL